LILVLAYANKGLAAWDAAGQNVGILQELISPFLRHCENVSARNLHWYLLAVIGGTKAWQRA
jgi:hypothetical protein